MEIDNELVVTYIDDNFDNSLVEVLRKGSVDLKYRLNNLKFSADSFDIEEFLDNRDIKGAAVIIMDSKLFQTSKTKKKVYGEELMVILKRNLPFCSFLLITQENNYEEIHAIKKYDSRLETDQPEEYYEKEIMPFVKSGLNSRLQIEAVANRNGFKTNDLRGLSPFLKDEINGDYSYSSLRVSDIDRLIQTVHEVLEGHE